MNDINKRFAQSLARLKANGKTQKAVAEALGLSEQGISLIKTGKNNPKESTLKNYCNTFGINYIWITTGDGDMFVSYEEQLLKKLQQDYNLSDVETVVVKTYLDQDEQSRKKITEFLTSLAANLKKG